MSEWKEYIIIIISVATLIVAIAAYVVARRSYKYAKESEKRNILNKIASKKAQLESFKGNLKYTADDYVKTKAVMLEAEIEQLKQQLKDYERVERI